MDSPYLSSSSSSVARPRVDSTFSIHLADTGVIHKRNSLRTNRTRSISATTLERHPELLPEGVRERLNLGPPAISDENWGHQKQSPRPQLLQTPFTPPVSNPQRSSQPGTTVSGLSSQPVHSTDPKGPSTPYSTHASPPVTSADMASLGYLPTPHYTNMAFHDPSYDSNYQQIESQSNVHSSNNFNFLFGSSAPPSQQPLYTSGPLHMEPTFSTAPLEPPMNTLNRASSPFQQPSFDSLDYALPQSQNQIPVSRSISHSPMSQHLGPLTPPLTSGLDAPPQLAGSPLQPSIESIRSPAMYETHGYSASYTAPPAPAPLYQTPQSYSYPPAQPSSARQQLRKPSSESHVRVINQKPKPQCWEHGCNGREFSTFSNLLRHQREKSGTAAKSYCPKCGAEFTRTTARNGHLAHEKCSKQRRSSDIK